MEYVLGYLAGSGASAGTVIATVLGCLVIGVIFKALFGDH